MIKLQFHMTTFINTYDENGIYYERPKNLSDEGIIETAQANLAAQADDTYFDGVIDLNINGQLFVGGRLGTSSLLLTWEDFTCFKERLSEGKAQITFLDMVVDFYILPVEEGYQLMTFELDLVVDANDYVISSTTREVLSAIIPKDIFEEEVGRACGEFIQFCEKANLPVNKSELASLKEHYLAFIEPKIR
ncbi:hypothetical protein [Paenibacillus sp. LHD-38]|uniref:hypothetical protein n=1 Tax=Paenibacillus sp. LHD-38 TaxID=3072143 RepID=UPI0028101347|nr:hypothetical protein [Paenibacillus sp. LHD-38]MDQ8738022.1 hypothetical protein [Paenibacillus sp. LHD-38]